MVAYPRVASRRFMKGPSCRSTRTKAPADGWFKPPCARVVTKEAMTSFSLANSLSSRPRVSAQDGRSQRGHVGTKEGRFVRWLLSNDMEDR